MSWQILGVLQTSSLLLLYIPIALYIYFGQKNINCLQVLLPYKASASSRKEFQNESILWFSLNYITQLKGLYFLDVDFQNP